MNAVAKKLIHIAGIILVIGFSGSPAFSQQVASTSIGQGAGGGLSQSAVTGAGQTTTGLPPLYGFTQASRINTGITGARDAGLTTGHGSYMPNAWGADEFLAPPGE